MAYVLHRTPCCRSIWESRRNKGGGEKKDPFFMKITYLGDGNNPVNFLLKKVNAFGDTYDLDESSISKMTLDGTEIKFEDLTLANKGEYGGTTDIYTYIFNDTNEHELIIYSDSLKILRFTGLANGPDASDKVRFKNIKSVDINNNITTIDKNTFRGCTGLTTITIPNSVTSIGEDAFSYCTGLTEVIIGNSVTSIGTSAFRGCTGLTEVNFNATNCTYMGSYDYPVFKGCSSLITINIGDNVETIPSYAFRGCIGLTEVTIPNSVTSIGEDAFSYCTGLTEVIIGNSVTSIGGSTFSDCTGLTSITSLATTAPTIYSSTFNSIKTGGTLTVPSGSTGYDAWMQNANYYLGKYNWSKVEQ